MTVEHGGKSKRIIWLEADRFDTKPNKSPWIEMSRVLNSHGFDVTLVTGYEIAPYTCAGLNIISLRARDIPFFYRVSLLIKMLLWVKSNAEKSDIIILKPESLLIAPILKRSGFSNLHLDVRTLPLRNLSSFKARIDHWMFWTFSLARLRKYIFSYSFITERLKTAIEQEFRIKFADYAIWQSSVNMKVFRPLPDMKREEVRNIYTIFYHGNIYRTRGVDKIIEAMSLLSPDYQGLIRLVIVGPDRGEVSLQEIARRYGVENFVIPTGYIPYEDIPESIAQADCCICPLPDLLEWNVSSPLKVFEYMACGKPVILTPIAAHKDVAEGLKFIVWTIGYGADDIRKAIEYSFEHRDRLKEEAKNARDYMRDKYDWEVQGKQLSDYLFCKYRGS